LLGSLVLGLLKIAIIAVPPRSVPIGIVVLAVLGGLSVAICNGKRWARNTFVVLFLLGIPGLLFVRDSLTSQGLLSMTILAVQTIMQVAAMVLLFLPASRPWFSRTAHEPEGTLS
jgi:hypothetical protein